MTSLSRTYRPKNFSDITGQDSTKETIRREVVTGKLGSAYLFSGPRGIGKTTMARVFAKALNCLEQKKGEPCNECAACREQNTGQALDIIEMDAASNTGVDNIREAIIEHVRFTPHTRKYKVYILDEAHMLSVSAWNALLKTLEEPPAYAIFILVTTELHKVPITIQSRCQRFDFKRIKDADLKERIKTIAERENLKLDPLVISSIVTKADGCVRDAENFLGQLMALGEKEITPEIAGLVLPESRLPIAASLLKTWSSRELGPSLEAVKTIEEQGIPLMTVFDDLIQAVRLLLIAADSLDFQKRLEQGDEGEKKLAGLIQIFNPAELTDLALLFMERRRDAKQGADVRFCLELAAAAVALGMLTPGPGKTNIEKTITNEIKSTTQTESKAAEQTEPIKQNSANTAFTLSDVKAKWHLFLEILNEQSRSLAFILKFSQPIDVKENILVISFKCTFHREKIMEEIKSKRLIEECLREVLGSSNLLVDGITENQKSIEVKPTDMVGKILKTFEGQMVEERSI